MTQSPQVFRREHEEDVLIMTILRRVSEMSEESVAEELQELVNAIRQGPIQKIVVDFTLVPGFGSTVLEILVKLRREAGGNQARIAVCGLSETGREVMTISRLEKVFQVCVDRQEAMDAVS